MSYKISMNDFGEIITVNNTQNKKQNCFSIQDKFVTSYFEEIILSKDISLIKWELQTKEDLEVFGDYSNDSLCFRVILNGQYQQIENNSNTQTHLNKNEISCISMKEIKGKEVYKKDIKNQVLDIYLGPDFFQKKMPQSSQTFQKKIQEPHFYKVLNQKKSFHQTITCAHQIFNSPFKNELDALFIQGKALTLLSYELNHILFPKKPVQNKHIKFNDYDKIALQKAQEILKTNLDNPPSIQELAKQIKLNEFKLKYGFKHFFNTTPYALLLEYRMKRAHELLQTSDYNISEISDIVGYKQSSNFTKAFYKQFGVLPKELMKSRQYYY